MHRLCVGLLLGGWAVATHAAQAEEDFWGSLQEPLSIQFMHSGQPSPSLRSTNATFTRSANNAPDEFGGHSQSRLPAVVSQKKQANWTTSARWQLISVSDNGRVSLAPVLRDESKGEQLEIKPKRNSLWMMWRKAFP